MTPRDDVPPLGVNFDGTPTVCPDTCLDLGSKR